MSKHGKQLVRLIRDALTIAGFSCITYGMYLAWPPLAWLAGGSALCSLALAALRTESKARE